MLVHIVADHPNKISDLHPLFGSQHVITSALLYGKDRLPKDCDAIIARCRSPERREHRRPQNGIDSLQICPATSIACR